MSWFQDLAGKAENLLNQIDQNAANVLHKPDEKNPSSNLPIPDVQLEIECEKAMPEPTPKYTMSLKKSTSSISLDASKRPLVEITNEHRQEQPNICWDNVITPIKSHSSATSRRTSISSIADAKSVIESDPLLVGDGIPIEFSDTSSMSISVDFENVSNTHNNTAKSSLEEAMDRIQVLQSRANAAELEVDSLRVELDAINQRYQCTVSELEAKLTKSIQSEVDTNAQLKWSKQEADQAKEEFQQYRARAQSTLLMKDKLIEQLKSNSETIQLPADREASTNSLELEHLRKEKAALLDESRRMCEQLDQVRGYADRLESAQQSQKDIFDQQLATLNANIRTEEAKWRDYESQNRAQQRELQIVREEMSRLQHDFAKQLHAKETELVQNSAVRQHSVVSGDLEQRVQSLTQSLVQKQTSLESVTADRNALRFQLEKIEQQHRDAMTQLRQQRPQVINLNDTDDAKARLPLFMQETPFDTRVSRRVKRVYSTLDSMGIRLGVFLRRYPLVRILTIFYGVLLHLWVLVVLCSSAPN